MIMRTGTRSHRRELLLHLRARLSVIILIWLIDVRRTEIQTLYKMKGKTLYGQDDHSGPVVRARRTNRGATPL